VLINVTARAAIPGPRLRTMVVGRNARSGHKYIVAYNLCDGSRGVTEVARLSGLNHGNLSRVIARWIEDGVMFKLGSDAGPVHLYRILDVGADDDAPSAEASPREEEGNASPASTSRPSLRARSSRSVSRGVGTGADAAAEPAAAPPAPRDAESLELPLDVRGEVSAQ
jgi:hypothetical protein